MFSALGRFAYRCRAWVLLGTAAFVVFALGWGTGLFDAVSDGGFEDPEAESTRAAEVIEERLGHDGVDVVAVYRSDELTFDNPTFAKAVQRAVSELPDEYVVSATTYLDDGLSDLERGVLISEDRHAVYVPITLAGDDAVERMESFRQIARDLDAGPLDTYVGGPIAIQNELSEQARTDVVRAELISLPLVLVLLVAIFGGVVAALMPLAVGGLAILGALVLLRALTYVTEVSAFAVNVASILGLGLAIDYGLFLVNRFREEMRRTGQVTSALPATLATAGGPSPSPGLPSSSLLPGCCSSRNPSWDRSAWAGSLSSCSTSWPRSSSSPLCSPWSARASTRCGCPSACGAAPARTSTTG